MLQIVASRCSFRGTSASSARTLIVGHMTNTSQPYARTRFRAPAERDALPSICLTSCSLADHLEARRCQNAPAGPKTRLHARVTIWGPELTSQLSPKPKILN